MTLLQLPLWPERRIWAHIKANTNTSPPTLKAKSCQTMRTFQWEKTELWSQLALCYGKIWTTLMKDYCLHPFHKWKPNFNFPWIIFWPEATLLIWAVFRFYMPCFYWVGYLKWLCLTIQGSLSNVEGWGSDKERSQHELQMYKVILSTS